MFGSWNPAVIDCVWIPDHTSKKKMLPVCVCTHIKRETTLIWDLADKTNDTGYLGEVLGVEHRSETVGILVLSTCNTSIYLERHWSTECLQWIILQKAKPRWWYMKICDTHHCENLGAFPELLRLKSFWCTVERGRHWIFAEHCPHSPLTAVAPLFASHCSNTWDGPAGSAHFGTKCRRICKGICPLQASISRCRLVTVHLVPTN